MQLSTDPGAIRLKRAMHDHWVLFLGEGVVLTALGFAAIVVSPLAGFVVTVFLGWVLLVAGISGLVFTLRARGAPGLGWALVSALVALVAGATLLLSPLEGLVTLTLVLIGYFIADGILTIALAVAHRRELSGRWEWMLVNGIVDLMLAGIVIAGMPGTLVWTLGLLVGIDMLFGGLALIGMAFEARRSALA
jgi:uncharacterized membrane protein HdeD (DUF308 family)